MRLLSHKKPQFVSLAFQCLHILLLLLLQCPPKVFLLGHNTVSASSFFSELSSLSGHSGGSQLVQMSHKTKRRRRRVIDGEIITAADIIGREGAESKRFIEYKLIIQFL